MATESPNRQVLSLRGEVVEISECEGRRVMKVNVEPRNVVDVVADCPTETHLGDLVRLVVTVHVERVVPE